MVNAVISIHGRPDEIVVELTRELKLNDKDKEEHNKRIRKDTAAAPARSKKLEEEGFPDTGSNRMLLRLWEELNPSNPIDRRCPYCGEPVGVEALFSSEADIDHFLPYSRTLDDSVGNTEYKRALLGILRSVFSPAHNRQRILRCRATPSNSPLTIVLFDEIDVCLPR